jgi:hypothetical protein
MIDMESSQLTLGFVMQLSLRSSVVHGLCGLGCIMQTLQFALISSLSQLQILVTL